MNRLLTYREAIQEAMQEEMRRDGGVFLLGEDIGLHGGPYKATKRLYEEFGDSRIMDTPISESAIAGVAMGAAMAGLRPIAEIMYIDFMTLCMDQVVNQIAKARYMSAGQIELPLVIRTQGGAGRSSAAQHSQSLEAWFIHVPGLKVVMPSTPYDTKGLLKTAIRDNDPVVFIEHKSLYGISGEVPPVEYLIPFGQADIKHTGKDVTIITYSRMVHVSKEAADELEETGTSVEVIDLRSLNPLDIETIVESVKKTHRVIIVEEDCKTGGVGAEIGFCINEHVFDYLDAPMVRVACRDIPIPYAPNLEGEALPDKISIIKAVRAMIR